MYEYAELLSRVQSRTGDGVVVRDPATEEIVGFAPEHPLVTTERFGPVLPIVRYEEPDEAIHLANALDVGLGASVWSSNPEQARRVASRVEAGTVWINPHARLDGRLPFGGTKQSGYGLEFGVEGLKSAAVPRVIAG